MYTDSWYCYSGHDFITRHISNVKENNTYQYIYTHKGESSPLGVSHGDELNLQFYPYLEDVIPLEEEDQKMSDLFVELWKSFIKNGSPTAKTVAWEPIWISMIDIISIFLQMHLWRTCQATMKNE